MLGEERERSIGVDHHCKRVELRLVRYRRNDATPRECVKDEGGDADCVELARPGVGSAADAPRAVDQDHRRHSHARGSGNAQLAPERYLLAALLFAGKELPARKRHRVHGAHFEAQRERRLGRGRERQQRGERESYRLSHVILLPRSLREPHPCELPRIPLSRAGCRSANPGGMMPASPVIRRDRYQGGAMKTFLLVFAAAAGSSCALMAQVKINPNVPTSAHAASPLTLVALA